MSNQDAKQHFLQILLPRLAADQVDESCQQVAAEIMARHVNIALVNHLQSLKRDGATIVMASASLNIYLRYLAQRFGIDELICTELERPQNGCYSGLFASQNCYGDVKAHRLGQLLKQYSAECQSWFYSDHHSDWPSLMLVDHPVMVRPTKKLQSLGLKHNVPVFGGSK